MYVKNFVDPETKKNIFEIVFYLKKAFKEDMLEKLEWMDDVTKKRAIEKLEAMDQFIAYEDEFLDKSIVDGFFKNIKISLTDHFQNGLNLNLFWKIFNQNRLREQINPKSWLEHTDISVVNALYRGSANYIEFPAGLLQGTFYNPNIPKYINFGSIGVAIGHEITHGFDDRGRQRNWKGNIQNISSFLWLDCQKIKFL